MEREKRENAKIAENGPRLDELLFLSASSAPRRPFAFHSRARNTGPCGHFWDTFWSI